MRAQRALDQKRALFLLERQLQQQAPDSQSRRESDAAASSRSRASHSTDSRRTSDREEPASGKSSRRVSGVLDARLSAFYAPPARMSNKKLVRNALSTVCLAGGALKLERERALLVSHRSDLIGCVSCRTSM